MSTTDSDEDIQEFFVEDRRTPHVLPGIMFGFTVFDHDYASYIYLHGQYRLEGGRARIVGLWRHPRGIPSREFNLTSVDETIDYPHSSFYGGILVTEHGVVDEECQIVFQPDDEDFFLIYATGRNQTGCYLMRGAFERATEEITFRRLYFFDF